jgi:MinD-like ATPase involved in chromosome partitioning or flagellar assembly
MLKVYKFLYELEEFLKIKKNDKSIEAYKIIVDLDTSLIVKVVSDSDIIRQEIENLPYSINIYIEDIISIQEYNNEEYLQHTINNEVDWSFKKRFDSFSFKKKLNFDIPIVSFYSYKGGVGRTTSLITFANYYAYHHQKNVVILDFDFEAPGVINFFDIDFVENPKNGVIEYILDSQASTEALNFNDYYVEVSKKFSGDGSIQIMPAGNIFNFENIESYIEGLARIDINSAETIVQKIEKLLNTIKKELNPDLILIDSRTGFSDVFGLLSHSISSSVVGFFTNNKQNTPGLEMFLHTMIQNDSPNTLLVNSQIHHDTQHTSRFKKFKEKVDEITINMTGDSFSFHSIFIERVALFTEIGSSDEEIEDYIYFIKNKISNTSYKDFFDALIQSLPNKTTLHIGNTADTIKNNISTIELKKELLFKLQENLPELYADNIQYDENFMQNQFYFRNCMEDIFNKDKFLLIGGKGTGKTALYNALKNDNFILALQNKANKAQIKVKIIDIISISTDQAKTKYFSIDNLNNDEIKDKNFFYKRFWQIYILNSLAIEHQKLGYNFTNFIPLILNETNTAEAKQFFEKFIYDDTKFGLIQEELHALDKFLKLKDINLFITFDQLDFIAIPSTWNETIAPLLEICRSFSYQKIQAKVFIRRDLFEKLSNITNILSLGTKSISLEWTKDEIFAFFFKIVIAYTKEQFFQIMENYGDTNQSLIDSIKKYLNKPQKYNQIPLEEYYILPFVHTFFGEYAYVGDDKKKEKSFGTIYDWFYNNLKNADNTISLRPFLDLISKAIDKYITSDKFHDHEKPILPQKFHTNQEVRIYAVERHFRDLAREKGNEDLDMIITFMHDSKFPAKFRRRVLIGEKYEEFLQYLSAQLQDLKAKKTNEIEDILIINGIAKITRIKSNRKKAEFALLYKYYLGLEG